MINWIFIGIGGSLGAITRYAVSQLLKPYSKTFPIATFTVNMIGSFAFGIILGADLFYHKNTYLFFTGGFLGAFTTFSTFSFESVTLLTRKEFMKSLIYISIHLITALTMAATGFYLMK